MEPFEAFAQEAVRFADWATRPSPYGSESARVAVVRICSLYLAALQLPAAELGGCEDRDDDRVERENVIVSSSIPLDLYGEVFNPLIIPPEEPVIASIDDDIKDIYCDVVTGLRAYQCGDLARAHWQWTFNFADHWGEHATGAIRALNAWLGANSDH